MAYTPVPAVVAGDWIDETFINTYWGDNMAAGVPDIFTAKGQLAVASGADAAGALSVGSDTKVLMADSAQSLGVKWDFPVVIFSSLASVTGWTSATSKGTGTYTLANTDISTSVPATAKAIFVTARAQWADVSSSPSVVVERDTGNAGIVLYGQINNRIIASSGIVPLNSGAWQVRVLTATVNVVTLYVWGYIP